MAITGTIHRAGSLKQTNKSHKHGQHRSKRELDTENKGRVPVKTSTKRNNKVMRREDRRLQQHQLRKNKRDEAIDKKRKLGGLTKSAPFLTCFVALNELVDVDSALAIIESCEEDAVLDKTNPLITYMKSLRLKQRFSFVKSKCGIGNEMKALDYLKVCDSTVLVISAQSEDAVDKVGDKFLNFAIAQGIPTPIVALMDLESVNPKKRSQVKMDIQKRMNIYFPDEKLIVLDKTTDGLNLLRKIGGQKRKTLHNKENRVHMYSEKVEYSDSTLKLTGYVRGIPLNVNNLVYIPELGTFQMSQIDSALDPMSVEGCSAQVLAKANPALQCPLISENTPDEMDAEQAFPSEAEIAQSMADNKERKLIKRIPKGMSDYQACWVPDIEELDENEDYSDDDEEDSKSFMSCDSNTSLPKHVKNDDEMEADGSDNEEYEDVTDEQSQVPNKEQQYDDQMDLYEEYETQEKLKAQRSDAAFPDEMDTPANAPARTRFQKYRGLESFRTSPWDPKENLPYDYARIFQFKDFDRIKRRIIKEAANCDGDVMSGMYVTIHIMNVSNEAWENYKSTRCTDNIILYGLLPHENKMSLLNVVLKRSPSSTIPIKSKERLIFQCGFRRFIVNPIFSQHTNGNKHKYERFFQPNSTVVASFFAPIQFPPAPVLCFRENPNGSLSLIASGSLMSCNPDRIALKRVVLSGHPFKIHKRTATIRFMFHNKDDVSYFKPCKLRTKCGRIGHIKESLGTHGHMKCVFDGQLKSFDTIFLQLYKRMFPKWTYEEYKRNPVKSDDTKME